VNVLDENQNANENGGDDEVPTTKMKFIKRLLRSNVFLVMLLLLLLMVLLLLNLKIFFHFRGAQVMRDSR
jgi:hypothetical protein